MAQIVNVIMTDDLDGKEGTANDPVETRHFSVGAGALEIDLRRTNFEKLQNAVAPYAAVARTTSRNHRPATASGRAGARPSRTVESRERSATIRAWAEKQGIPVSKRGRIPKDVENRYDATHPF